MLPRPLPAHLEKLGFELIELFRIKLNGMLGGSHRELDPCDILQSEEGPTLFVQASKLAIVVGPNAVCHEPAFVANLAHEYLHFYLADGTYGNASGLEEGLATHFEMSAIQARFGLSERKHFEMHLPKSYLAALRDYEQLIRLSPDAARRVLGKFGKLSGLTIWQIHGMFPELGWCRCYRLSKRKRMR